ncbi:uncharacterized protein LOC114316623 [Camellia sinensis]|uniref:uncharacterized protein LOC114316623 n=1 Tax=Camellia sinensis TaxID=4442 RepID=UPI00103610DE|nr:uncharacterized protein LOC114316623 [Camellia sinensis]
MGFRSLKAFNKALLAKQGWRLLSVPDSLVARILKAKYYPHTTFLQANVGSNPSFTWRSIFNARPLLEVELRWRVGDGRSIQIWGDKWVLRPHSFRVCSPHSPQLQGALVSDLIDEDRHCWDVNVLRENLLEMDVEAIRQIPICCYGIPDKLNQFFGNGIYCRRICVMACGDAAETVMHCLWDCMRAREVWNQSPISFVLDHGGGGDFMGWAYGIGRRTDSVTLGLFFTLCWGLWSSRNQALFSNVIHSTAATVQMVCERSVGVGVVIRDLNGIPIAALSEPIPQWMEIDCIEAIAAVKALDFAVGLGLTNIHLEGDSLTMVNAMREDGYLNASFGHFVEYAIDRSKQFSSFCVSHTRRSGNVMAHHLAQMAKKDPKKQVWMAGVPEHLHDLHFLNKRKK